MTSELTDRIWGRLGLSAVQAPLEEPRAPSAKAAVTELRPRKAAWTPSTPCGRLQDLLAIRLPFLAKVWVMLTGLVLRLEVR